MTQQTTHTSQSNVVPTTQQPQVTVAPIGRPQPGQEDITEPLNTSSPLQLHSQKMISSLGVSLFVVLTLKKFSK